MDWSVTVVLRRARGVEGTYEGRGVAGDPGNEDNLVSARRISVGFQRSLYFFFSAVPLALTTSEFILDIVDGVPGSRAALGILGGLEFAPEHLVVWVLRDLIDDNLLAVVGDLEDDELGLSPAHAEVVECRDALIIDRDSNVARDPSASEHRR